MQKLNDSLAHRRRLVLAVATPLLALVGFALWSDVAGAGPAQGPDVTVIYLGSTTNYGAAGGKRGYSVGTTSCNVGTQPVWWCNENRAYCDDSQHPVIAQNLYRLKDGRFVQLGQSWLKHGFLSTNSPDANCGVGQSPPHGGDQLGVGLIDTYGSTLNGSRPLGKRSEVNAATGIFPYPYTVAGTATVYDQLVVVEEAEINPSLNPGARFFVEGHYITADDAAAGNGWNNASYREVTVGASPFNLSLTGSAVREKPALAAWKSIDSDVAFVAIDTPSSPPERFHVARKVTQVAPSTWHYEFAVHNLDSDRGAQAFQVQFPAAATIGGAGFYAVASHSGEPYSNTPWAVEADGANGRIAWSTETSNVNPNANALRWSTMYNFWFDADLPPAGSLSTLTFFKPGNPATLDIEMSRFFADGFERGTRNLWSSGTN